MRVIVILKILRLGRLHFVMGGFLLFCFGTLLAMNSGADIDAWRFILGYAAVFAAHLSVSYSNDHFDYDADAFVTPTPFSGGSGVLRENPELRPLALALAVALTAASLVGVLAFTLSFGLSAGFPALVATGLALGWAYTAPPFRLAYRGLGEVSTVFSLGFLLPVSGYYVTAGALDDTILAFSAVFLVYGMLFILSVQIPDSEGDAKAGKMTAIVRMGRERGMSLAIAMAALASAGFAALYLMGHGTGLALALLSVLPLCASLAGKRIAVREAKAVMFTNISMTSLILMILFSNIYLLMTL